MQKLGVIDILKLYGFDPKTPAKIIRHADKRYPVDELIRNGWLDIYQAYQSKPVFTNQRVILSFYGLTGTRSCFYGVFKVNDDGRGAKRIIPVDCEWAQEWNARCPFFYNLERLPQFDALKDRLVIDWGKGALSWQQHISETTNNKPVLELFAEGRQLPAFDDYLEFSLSYQELEILIKSGDAHRDWQSALKAIAGVYLVLAEKTGDLYVGSAYGVNGVWGRWADYTQTGGHGNNKLLKELVAKNADYPKHFRFSLLQILPKSLDKDEVIKREGKLKEKLGTRATGLNRSEGPKQKGEQVIEI